MSIYLKFSTLAVSLVKIYWTNQHGIRNAIFDDDLKLANITPTHKKDDITDANNYRPISILPKVSKLFERIIQNQIAFFIENTLNRHLCGYKKGFSTQHAIISLLERCKCSIDKKASGVLY